MRKLKAEYDLKKKAIKKRLSEFKKVLNKNDEDVFAELCYCLFTPRAKAVNCDKAVGELKSSGLLVKGGKAEIASRLKGLVRFHNNKASYVVTARNFFTNEGRLSIKDWLKKDDIFEIRKELVRHVKGMGYKAASHFLRNVGLAKDMAILDTHILKNLKKYKKYSGVEEIPKSLTVGNYLEIERKMKNFSLEIGIPIEELDLLFWSSETGFIFK